jgi:hypothetical protein
LSELALSTSLLQLYDNDWSLIEDENYRALADSYFDEQECKVCIYIRHIYIRVLDTGGLMPRKGCFLLFIHRVRNVIGLLH